MALDQQVIGQLDSNKGDASLALGGNIPFAPIITDQTIKVFQDLTNKDIKRREDEYQNWEKGVATKIAEVSKIDNVLDADREVLGKKKSEIVKEIQNKAYLLHPSNQIKHRGEYDDLMTKVNDYIVEVDKSKQDAILDKDYRKGMREKAEWANPINESRYQKWRATPMSEREPFALMADPSASMTKRILEAQKGAITNQATTYQYSPDNAMVTVKETATLDPERYYNALRTPEEEAYYKAYYRDILTPQQKQELASMKKPILTEDDYAKDMYMKTFAETIVLPSKTTPNPEFLQEQAYKRAEMQAGNRKEIAEMNNDTKEKIASDKLEAQRNELTPKADINSYSVLKPINDNINSLQSNIAGSITLNADLAKQYPTIKSVKEVDSKSALDDIKKVMYSNGADAYGNAYGKIYIVDDKKEGIYYLPAKVIYTDKKGKEIDKKLYLADKANYNEIIVPDVNNKFTKEQILARVADNTQTGKAQYNDYIKSKTDLGELDKQVSGKQSINTFLDALVPTENKGGNPSQRNMMGSSALGNYQMIDSTRHSIYEQMGIPKNQFDVVDEKFKNDAGFQKQVASVYASELESKIPKNIQGANRIKMLAKGWYTGDVNYPDNKVPNPAQNKMTAGQYANIILRNLGTNVYTENNYGKRVDGTNKGNGYFGKLKMKDGSGNDATEISIGIEIDGKETQIPTLVPTLTESEKEWLLKGNNPNDRSSIGESIINKAITHAEKRMKEGKSPFADEAPKKTTNTKKSNTYKSPSGIKFTVE
jgi:hypothetical protein